MRKLSLLFVLSLVAISGFSQNLERYNWYFGSSNQALRFNRTSQIPAITTKATPFGGGGSATASDASNANLLFYTDGQFVYDATNTQMPLGFGLNANVSANQPVAMCKVPGVTDKYFIFTNTANFTSGGSISVSVVDMGLPGNAAFPAPFLGNIESKNAAIPGLNLRSEAMMIVPHNNGTDFWLLTHQVNTSNYSATLINNGSYVSSTFNTNTTSGVSPVPLTAANFSYHAGKGKIAVSAQNSNTDAIILNFNNTTGVFSFDKTILNSGLPTTTNQSIYDIEWSTKGDFLYLSRFGETGVTADLLQYDYNNPTTTLTSVLTGPLFRSYGVQMAPDSSIYHLYQLTSVSPILLAKFSKTDTIASQVKYQTGVLTSTSFAGTQFSSFAPRSNVTLVVDFTSIGSCQNNNTTFFPNVLPGADSLNWNFGDGQRSNDWSPVHKYGSASTFNVVLKAFYQGQVDSVSKPVTITPFTLQLNLVQDTTACSCELPFPIKPTPTCNRPFSVTAKVTGGTPISYTWSNGDTGPTLTPDSAGYYYVVVTDASGCSTYAGVNVKEYGVQDQRANIWYFGKNAGIDFNVSPPIALNKSAMDAPEGCADICDRNGQIIFYTDGFNVWNKNDVLISPATGIGGDPNASQSAIIVPVPGDETLFYIFTNEAIDGTSGNIVKYSLFDLKQNAGTGAVVKDNQMLFAKGTERITASGKWLIIHEYGNNTFRTYEISNAGIGDPVLTAIGSDHSFTSATSGMGYMKLGPNNQLAVALATGSQNLVELFQLNDSTGKIFNYRKIDLKQPAGQVYGIEFSPGGSKVFATVKGSPTPSFLYEYFLDSLTNPHFKQKIQQTLELGAIQLAPDGQLYVAINGSTSLATIQAADDTTRLSTVNFSGFALKSGTLSHLGLPNFIQQISNGFGGPALDVAGVCLGTPTQFTGTATDPIDQFQWFFGDGGGDTQASPTHTYGAAGTYSVSMHLTNRCGLDTTLVKPTTIFAPPAKPTIPPAAVLCNGPVMLDANTANTPGLMYFWSDQTTLQTKTITVQSVVSVTISDVNGCSSTGTTIVVDNTPKVDLGPDQTLCQNSLPPTLNANNPGLNFTWTVNGGATTTAQSRQVDTTIPGVYVYKVVVTDPITTCTTTDQVTFTIISSPVFTLNGTNPTSCNASDGTLAIQLSATAPPTGPYSYFVNGPNSFNTQGVDKTAPQLINIPGLKAGIYTVVVSDQISGCSISQSFGLTDAPFTASALALAPNCDPVTIQITTNAVSFPLQYQITPVGPGTPVGPITGIATAVFNTQPVTAGTYTIQVQDNGGCTFIINNFVVTPNAPVSFTTTPLVCTTPPTLVASGATTYQWSGPGIVGPSANAIVQISGTGSQTYTVIGSSPGNCPSTQTITVVLDNPTVDFSQTDPCANSINLTASPSGPYTYRWYKGGVFQPGLLGQTVSVGVSENGASYSAEVVNSLNGCSYQSAPKTLQVLGTVDASVTATLACNDTKPFTLTSATTATGVTYAWFKNNVVISGLTTSSITQTDAGLYRVEISKSTTCKATAEITVIRAPIPVGSLPNRLIICSDPENTDPTTSQVDLDPGKFKAYNWFKNELTLNYTLEVLTATSAGKYRVDLTNDFGCVASDETEVNNECIPKIEVPNAFRPSSSLNENKDFYAFTFFIKNDNFQIFLYNRWGELVYTSTDRYFHWNGGFNGIASQPVPGGSYAYVIRYVSAFHPERGIQEKRGGVALLR